MSDCSEVLFISDDTGQLQCVDPRIGTTFISYRGLTSVTKNAVAIIGKDYLIASDANQPLIKIWPLNSQEPVGGPKMILAGKLSALAVSKDGFHCVGAIDTKLYIYNLSTGSLLAVLDKHFRGITKIVFMDDSAHFVSCGKSGTVLVWSLSTATSGQGSGTVSSDTFIQEPVYSFSHHSLPVTDAFVGPQSMLSRLYTVSLDQTCKIYNLRSGDLLCSIVFDCSLFAVTPSSIHSSLFLGTSVGEIIEYSIEPFPSSLNNNATENQVQQKFTGHQGRVTCLDVSLDGYLLVSAGDDKKTIVWDIPSRQLLRIFTLKGAPASVFLCDASENIFANNFVPSLEFGNLKRVSKEHGLFDVNILQKSKLSVLDFSEPEPVVVAPTKTPNIAEVEQLKLALSQALQKNKELYQFSMQTILNDPHKFEKKKKKKIEEN